VWADWENTLAPGNISTLLAAPDGDHQGCGAHNKSFAGQIVLIKRGGCMYAQKAVLAQNAGALGVIIWDNVEPTTVQSMVSASWAETPQIPAFLITMAEGTVLVSRLAAGEDVTVAMDWRPVTVYWVRFGHRLWPFLHFKRGVLAHDVHRLSELCFWPFPDRLLQKSVHWFR
jgi:hypothetical protein